MVERARRDIRQGEAAAGTARLETLVTGGEPDRGFRSFCNRHLLADGAPTYVTTTDGEECGRAEAGVEQEGLGSVVGECVVEDFPTPGPRTWLEGQSYVTQPNPSSQSSVDSAAIPGSPPRPPQRTTRGKYTQRNEHAGYAFPTGGQEEVYGMSL